jgi:hypothetical protein
MARRSVARANKPGEFGPSLSKEEANTAEARMTGSGDIAICRRITLQVMTLSQEQLMENWRDEVKAETMFKIADNVQEFIDHTKGTLELAESALARVLMTGQLVHPEDSTESVK